MCILCVVSRWSRRIVTMLPWLVIPFIITWAFSQLLPPGYRLEVTSTRLACLGVLLSSLGWYELLMPWLSSLRARRSAILRERRLIEAQEAAKWRKEATRRCRNCLTAYKIQTPGCGIFKCTYCGHVSKRPVLEVPPLLSQTGGQSLQRVLHSGGQLTNSALFRGSVTRHDGGCWSKSSERKSCWLVDGACGSENCKAWQAFIRVFQCIGNLFLSAGIMWRKFTGASKATVESCRGSQKAKDNSVNLHESRSEKARKRANERRQARLEKELLESEEKRQREEVARMVEERRRQREERLKIEKESEREAAAEREREIRRVKESERRRKDKVKERVGEQSELKVEQDMYATDNHVRSIEQVDAEKPIKLANTDKAAKVSVAIQHDPGSKMKVVTEIQTRPDFPKHGLVKHKLMPASKASSIFQKNGVWNDTKFDGQSSCSKVAKVDAAMSSNNTSVCLKSVDTEESSSTSRWRKAPWFNAWAKGSEVLKKQCISSESCSTSKYEEKPDLNRRDCGNFFNNKAVGTKQSSSSGSSLNIQPPIAPPSTHTGSLHQLFSTPTIFPPLDWTAKFGSQTEQISQGIKSSFCPEHTFFEAPARVTFHTCTELSVSSSPTTPAPLRDSHFLPLQLTVSADNGALQYIDGPRHSTLLGSAILPETAKPTDIHCSPLSPHTVSGSETATFNQNPDLSPHSFALKSNISNCCLEKHDTVSWELPSVPLEKTDNVIEESHDEMWGILAPCNSQVQEQLEPINKDKDMDALQLPHLSAVQSLFDSDILLPDLLSVSPQKEGSTLHSSDSRTYAGQAFDRKSLWSDLSAYNAAIQIWDDGDNHQKLPPEFVDCITQEIMRDPVITADGHSYERTAIEKWLMDHDTSPKTGEVLPPPPGGVGVDKTLRPNHILRGQIIEYNEKLAKMQRNAVAWSNTSKDGEYLATSTVLSF